ncbi:MAG: class I SAM-dependent methyltransferase, partial [Bacteroidetes bacterium]|nr:class I SAM-dependent methyltransferase [Bacteroidota bacterium]
ANGPDDGTEAYVKEQGEEFNKSLFFLESIGFTKAVNEGIKVAAGEYIVILNNDIALLPQPKNQWIELLKDPFENDPMVGITGPMVEKSIHIQKMFAIFFCVMISREVLDIVGLLDEAFSPGFCEDNDWCARAEDLGFKIVQVPVHESTHIQEHVTVGGFPIYHKGNRTFSLTDEYGHKKYTEGYARNIALLKSKYPITTNEETSKIEQIDGYMPTHEWRFLQIMVQGKKKVLEIGSWHGKSTRALAEYVDGVVYAVDTWYGSDNEPQNHGSAYLLHGDHAFMEFYRNNYDLIEKGKIIPIRMHSTNACNTFKQLGMKFDMIFIDGDHTYEGCKTDILNTEGLLEEGGFRCGHDYNSPWEGVKRAVDELVKNVRVQHTIWYEGMVKMEYITPLHAPGCIDFTVDETEIKKDCCVQPYVEGKLRPYLTLPKKHITDCILFYNELELLEIRLNELDSVVDEFIILESSFTHSDKPKALYFDKERFAKFMPKIKYVVLDTLPEGNTWTKEQYSRNRFKELVNPNTDIVILTDVDEIPNAKAVHCYNPRMGQRYLDMKLYYYWLNCYSSQWEQAMIIGYEDFMKSTPVQIRYSKCPKLEEGGWHFSFQGGVDRILDKIQAWAHSEFNRPDIANKEWIEEAINTPRDVLKRDNIKLQFVSLDTSYPKYILDNQDRFKDWIHV